MSLANAVLSVAEEIESFSKEWLTGSVQYTVLGFAKQLRVVVEAASTPPQMMSSLSMQTQVEDTYQQVVEKKRLEREQEKVVQIDGQGPRMVEIAATGEFVTISSGMPAGAKTCIGNSVFQLRDEKLYYLEEDTKKVFGGS
jgi:hypothetical protein